MLKLRPFPVILAFSIVFLAAAFSHSAKDHTIKFRAGYLKGDTFRDLNPAEKSGYAMGFVDGIFISPVFKARKQDLEWFESCVLKMSNEEIVETFENYLNDNPTYWHLPMNSLAYSAMAEGCSRWYRQF